MNTHTNTIEGAICEILRVAFKNKNPNTMTPEERAKAFELIPGTRGVMLGVLDMDFMEYRLVQIPGTPEADAYRKDKCRPLRMPGFMAAIELILLVEKIGVFGDNVDALEQCLLIPQDEFNWDTWRDTTWDTPRQWIETNLIKWQGTCGPHDIAGPANSPSRTKEDDEKAGRIIASVNETWETTDKPRYEADMDVAMSMAMPMPTCKSCERPVWNSYDADKDLLNMTKEYRDENNESTHKTLTTEDLDNYDAAPLTYVCLSCARSYVTAEAAHAHNLDKRKEEAKKAGKTSKVYFGPTLPDIQLMEPDTHVMLRTATILRNIAKNEALLDDKDKDETERLDVTSLIPWLSRAILKTRGTVSLEDKEE